MPKVRPLTHEKRLEEIERNICERCQYELFKKRIKQKDLAEALDISQGAISKQFQNRKLTLRVVAEVIYQTGADANEIFKLD